MMKEARFHRREDVDNEIHGDDGDDGNDNNNNDHRDDNNNSVRRVQQEQQQQQQRQQRRYDVDVEENATVHALATAPAITSSSSSSSAAAAVTALLADASAATDILRDTARLEELRDTLLAISSAWRQASRDDDAACSNVVRILQSTLCRLTLQLVPNAHQKLDEIVYVADHPEYTVSEETTGADLTTDDGRRFELKVSVRRAKKHAHACNFNWPLASSSKAAMQSMEARRELVVQNIRNKVRGGGAIMVVVDRRRNPVVQFELSEHFLDGYFQRIHLTSSNRVHNMGAPRCKDCGLYHRLDKLHRYSALLEERRISDESADLTDDEWKQVMAPEPTRCRKKTKGAEV